MYYLCVVQLNTILSMRPKNKFRSLPEIIRTFSNEDFCRRFLAMQRWHGKPVCPNCKSSKKIYNIEENKRYKCSECKYKFSVTVGTFFENTKVKLGDWFVAIYICNSHSKGISSLQLAIDLNITQKTAWFMLHRIREGLREKAPHMLSNVVEADETYLGGKESNKHANKRTKGTQGRNTKTKQPVFGVMERGGKIIVQPVEDVRGKTLKTIINENVKPNTTIVTDEWKSYNGLHVNFKHLKVEHGKGEYVNGIAHTNNMENFWSLLKRGINGIQHSISQKHAHRYCNEYGYRHNNRNVLAVTRFINSLSNLENSRLTYKDLISND